MQHTRPSYACTHRYKLTCSINILRVCYVIELNVTHDRQPRNIDSLPCSDIIIRSLRTVVFDYHQISPMFCWDWNCTWSIRQLHFTWRSESNTWINQRVLSSELTFYLQFKLPCESLIITSNRIQFHSLNQNNRDQSTPLMSIAFKIPGW